jgi:hypothetical protein
MVPVMRKIPTGRRSFTSFTSFMLDPDELDRVRKGGVDSQFKMLSPFFSKETDVKCAAAHRTVSEIFGARGKANLSLEDMYALALSWDASTSALEGYATLHAPHIEEISKIRESISSYAQDPTRKRPLTFLLIAPPGAGKSHFIDCIAKKMSSHAVVAHSFNMASMLTADELSAPLDEVRNTKVADKLPLLFLDEFDTDPAYFGFLLPLLWDGQLNIRHRKLTVAKLIVVLAGSTDALPRALDHARNMKSGTADENDTKLPDLLSRINGSVVTLPPFDVRPEDKVAIAVQLLRRRFGEELRHVPLGFLTLVSRLRYRYDVRSISQLIDRSHFGPPAAAETLKVSQILPDLNNEQHLRASPLAYHLIDDNEGPKGAVNLWKECINYSSLVPLYAPDTGLVERAEEIKMAIAYALQTPELAGVPRH